MIRAFWCASPLLRSGMRVLEAGCGTGALTFGVWEAAERRGIRLDAYDAFDFTPAMLDRLRASLRRRHVVGIRLAEANVLQLDALPADWRDYDLVVSALAPYKRLELVLDAYRGTGRPLKIVGTGPEEARSSEA